MPENTPQLAPTNGVQRALEQASAYKSMFAPTDMELTYPDGGGTETISIPPHPNLRMLPDDRLEAYEAMLFEAETTYDRAPDIHYPEQHLDNGAIVPATTSRGNLLSPYRITPKDENGEPTGPPKLVTPPWAQRIVRVAIGDDAYSKLVRAGKSAADVWRIWNEEGVDLAARQGVDQFPVSGGGQVAAARPRNSV